MNSDFLEILKQSNGNEENFKKLIMQNKNIINKEFKTIIGSKEYTYSPLTYCLDQKLSELSIFLIEQGANINYKTSPNEDYPLLIACRYGLEKVVKKLLMNKTIDINCLNKKNETWYSILLTNLNVTIYNLMQEYIKKKIIFNNLSVDFPLEYNNNFINTEISKYIFLILFITEIYFTNSYRNKTGNLIPKLIINLDRLNEYNTKNEIIVLNKKINELLKKIKKLENEVIILYN